MARWLAGWLAAGALMVALGNWISIPAALRVVPRGDAVLLGLAAILSLVQEMHFSAAKYRGMLALLESRLTFGSILRIRSGTCALEEILPFKLGVMLRMAVLKKELDVPLERSAGAMVLLAGVDLVTYALWAIVGLAMGGRPDPAVPFLVVLAVLAVAATGVGACAALLRLRRHVRASGLWFTVPEALARIVAPGRRTEAWGVLAWSVVCTGTEVAVCGLVLRACGVEVTWTTMLAGVPVVLIVSSLPFTPMGLGVREAGFVAVFWSPTAPEAILGAGLFASLILRILPAMVGLVFLPGLLATRRANEVEPAGARP